MDSSEFLHLSGKLVALGKAGARSATSRAYYGVFHLAQDILREMAAESCGSGRSHNLVPQFLESAGHPIAKEAATLLSDLHTARIKVDYHLDNETVEGREFAQGNVVLATEIQSRLLAFRDACESDASLRKALKDGVARVKETHKIKR